MEHSRELLKSVTTEPSQKNSLGHFATFDVPLGGLILLQD